MQKIDISSLPIVDNHDGIAPCVCKKSVGKFICIGLNYSDHAEETGMEVPPEPIIFFKATSAIIGPNDDVIIPQNSKKSDWEVELGVVIGKEAKYISEDQLLKINISLEKILIKKKWKNSQIQLEKEEFYSQ